MKLIINNFAKIKSAEINFDGLSIIAGENNTGKSTVGKIVFALFNATLDLEEKVLNQRKVEIQRAIPYSIMNAEQRGRKVSNGIKADIATNILEVVFGENKVADAASLKEEIEREFARAGLELDESILGELIEKIASILEVEDEKIVLEVITRYFSQVFGRQINSLIEEDEDARLELIVKEKRMCLRFKYNQCVSFEPQYELLHDAFYIDNPFTIDLINEIYFNDKLMEEHLLDRLTSRRENIMDDVFASVIAKEKLQEIERVLSKVIDGDIISETGDYYLSSPKYSHPVLIANLSTGLKAFSIIKLLLEKGCLREKDVLILDEPEIHLHPQWQIVYAEIIVLLEKCFDLTILITTHSPYFLDAIELYSQKYKMSAKNNYYLSQIINNVAVFNNVNDSINTIYEVMASPLQLLETLRQELNMEN